MFEYQIGRLRVDFLPIASISSLCSRPYRSHPQEASGFNQVQCSGHKELIDGKASAGEALLMRVSKQGFKCFSIELYAVRGLISRGQFP